ncbi:MAG: hypothetical protein EPO51_13305 [Phenylobacterium sp.]|uniref:hypothetical protein n=1 Tax=Phenylobacterium sp. TaxID=1871053 RepID=UPI001209AE88|nr:hypothetical protein [Phenylobacterium sp.]TAJ71274.1 MAG: hypothetical protein EPO51_13305 [Phenylobacterium sp.]
MQTFRAYLNGPAGTIIWAAWIEASDRATAQVRAAGLCAQGNPTVDLWTAAARIPVDDLEAV